MKISTALRHALRLSPRLALACTLLAALPARAEVVVIGNVDGSPMTLDQISDAYLGKSASVVLFDLGDAAPERAEFYRKALGKEPGQIKALWARLAFTGKAVPPREVADDGAVKKAVAGNPKAIGYIDQASVDGSVKVLLAPPH